MSSAHEHEPLVHDSKAGAGQPPVGELERKMREILNSSAPYLIAYAVVLGVLSVGWIVAYGWSFHLYHNYHTEACVAAIPRWLLVNAVVGLLTWCLVIVLFAVLWSALRLLANSRDNDEKAVQSALPSLFVIVCFACVIFILGVFLIAWKIYGSVIVYGIPRGPPAPACPPAVYDFSWYFIMIEWIVCGAAIIAQCAIIWAPTAGATAGGTATNKQT